MSCSLKAAFIPVIFIFAMVCLILLIIQENEIQNKFKQPEPLSALSIIPELGSQLEKELPSSVTVSTTETTKKLETTFTSKTTAVMVSTTETNRKLETTFTSKTTSTVSSIQSNLATTQNKVTNYGKSIVYSRDDCRIGNQLSSFSDLLSLEWQYGVRAFLNDFQYNLISLHFDSAELNNSVRLLSKEFPDHKHIQWKESYPPFGLQNMSSWPPEKFGAFYHAGVYINTVHNYYKFMPRLKNTFKFKSFLINEAVLRLLEVRDKALETNSVNTSFTFVSVHTRRTDYGNHLKVLYNLTYVNTSFFFNAMEYFKSKVENPLFYVLSDDPDWAEIHLTKNSYNVHVMHRRNVSMEGNVVLTDNDHIGIDLALLSLANHSIMSYGTFGMWGAFLSGGTITMPLSHSNTEATALKLKKANLSNLVFV